MTSNRDWTAHKRMSWWIKYIGMVAGLIVSIAGAARVLGINIDLMTKTEARAQHEIMKQEIHNEQVQVLQRIESKMDKLNDRIDAMTTAIVSRATHREK